MSISCTKCGYNFNFQKANEIIDDFVLIKNVADFIEEALQENNKIIGDFTLNQLTTNKIFVKLDSNKKNIVKILYKFTKTDLNNKGLLKCSSCQFIKFIDTGQILLEDTFGPSDKHDDIFNTPLRTLDKTLPRTREYTCYNKSCKSHKDKKLREAVIYRKTDTLQVTYMCCACNEYWRIN
jgi:hypothetical protein